MISEPYNFRMHHFSVEVAKRNKPISLWPLGDHHRFCTFHEENALKKTLNRIRGQLDDGHTCIFLQMGDELEGMSRKERRALVEGKFHDSTYLKLSKCFENEINAHVEDTSFMVEHPNAYMIGGVEGNHRGVIRRNKDESWKNSYDYMYERYRRRTPKGRPKPVNLGGMALIRLSIKAGGCSSGITICAVHGETIGGGRTKGGSINAVAKLTQVARANIYLAGHNHDKQASSGEVLELRTGKTGVGLTAQPVRYVRTGCYRKSYVDGESCYPAKSAYPPAVIGTPEITLTPTRPYKKRGKREMRIELEVNGV